MTGTITICLIGSRMKLGSSFGGVSGEGNATKLRLVFDESWAGLTKKVTFWDALGRNPVVRTMTADLLETTGDTSVYLCPIPQEALVHPGELTFVVDGYATGVRGRSVSGALRVEYAPDATDAAESADPTPTQAEQLQAEIDALLGDITDQADAAATSATAAASSETAAEGYKTAAAGSATAAAGSASAASSSAAAASSSATGAAADKAAAQAAKADAVAAKTEAVSAKTAAETAKAAAETAKDTAEEKATEAAGSASSADTHAAAATAKATEAAASALEAGSAKTDALSAKTGAESARDAAVLAKAGAEAAKSGAEAAQTAAASAQSGAVSAKNAAETAQGAAETALSGATAAKNAAEAANTSALGAKEAAVTAKAAAQAAKAGAESARTAAETAQADAISAKDAAQSSAGTAATQAGIATTKAGEAAVSAADAADSAAQAAAIVGGDFPTKAEAQEYANTAEADAKSYADAQIAAIPPVDISGKVDKVAGKGLSANDYTTAEKNKLAGVEAGAQVNVPATWDGVSGKPDTFPPTAHTHPKAQISDFPASMPPTAHVHAQSEVTGLATALAGKSPTTHTHTPEAIGAAAAVHTHDDRYFTEAETLSAATAALLGGVSTPDGALGKLGRLHGGLGNDYLWKKQELDLAWDEFVNPDGIGMFNIGQTVKVSHSVSYHNGNFLLNDPISVTISANTNLGSLLSENFITEGATVSEHIRAYYFPANATYFWNGTMACAGGVITCSNIRRILTTICYVNSPDPSAYPPAVSDGYAYTALGQVGSKVQIATGSYTGTGTYRASSPNSLTFDFVPKLLIVALQELSKWYGLSPSMEDNVWRNSFIWMLGQTQANVHDSVGNTYGSNSVETDGTTISWSNSTSAGSQLNASGKKYIYFAIG